MIVDPSYVSALLKMDHSLNISILGSKLVSFLAAKNLEDGAYLKVRKKGKKPMKIMFGFR